MPPTRFSRTLKQQNEDLHALLKAYDFYGKELPRVSNYVSFNQAVSIIMIATCINVIFYLAIWQFAQYGNPMAGQLLLVYTLINAVVAGMSAFTVIAFNKIPNKFD